MLSESRVGSDDEQPSDRVADARRASSTTITSTRRSGTTSRSATTTSSSRPTRSPARPGCSRSSRSCCSTAIEGLEVAEMSPWLDLRVPPKEVKLPVGRGADAPALHQDAPAGRRARLLAEGEVPLHRPRRARRRVEHVQPPRERERRLVRGAERHAGPRRSADRAAAELDPPVLPRLDGARRTSVLAVLGEHPDAGGRSATCRTC